MCGGILEQVLCSHIGHIFRSRSPYAWRTGTNVLKKNSVRLAEVWLDGYKKYYYERLNFDLVRANQQNVVRWEWIHVVRGICWLMSLRTNHLLFDCVFLFCCTELLQKFHFISIRKLLQSLLLEWLLLIKFNV